MNLILKLIVNIFCMKVEPLRYQEKWELNNTEIEIYARIECKDH